MVDFLAKEIGWREVVKLTISISAIASLLVGALLLGDWEWAQAIYPLFIEGLIRINGSF